LQILPYISKTVRQGHNNDGTLIESHR